MPKNGRKAAQKASKGLTVQTAQHQGAQLEREAAKVFGSTLGKFPAAKRR